MPDRNRSARRPRNAFSRQEPAHCNQCLGDSEAYLELGQAAFEFFLKSNTELGNAYRLGQRTSYVWDMDAATLTFFDNGQPRVVATIEFAGTYARVPQTWMWSWANPSIAAAVTGRMDKVREYGRKHDLAPLYADHWHAPEPHAVEMMAVTAYLLGGRGGYSVPGDMPGTTIYMVIMDAQWVG